MTIQQELDLSAKITLVIIEFSRIKEENESLKRENKFLKELLLKDKS